MNVWLLACVILLALGLLPVLWLAARGDATHRLVGLQLTASLAVLFLTAFSQAMHQPAYLIVPLALDVLGVAGTLVFTRLLAPRP